MLPLPRGAAWQTLFLLCAVLFINEIRSEGRVVCYYTNWSVYRPGTAKFNPQNINPYLCTHLVYAFGGFTKDNQMKPFDKYQDVEQGGYAKFTGLKTYNKQLKTMIAIGGWNEASSRFSPLMANPERRQQFIKNILKFLRQNHFDGIDLDWEYPAQREGGKQRDRDNYAQFVQELRAEFERESEKTGRPRLLLTMAVPAGIENIEKGYDIPKLNKYLDWFNVLTYDFHSSHEPSANHHAPLYSLEEESEYNYDAELNIDYSIKYYLKAGADRDKLVLGIPTYGRSYTLINEESTEIGAPSEGPGEQGDATREKGYLAYYEICQNLKDDPEWTVVQPNPNAMGPYAYRRNQWVGYDDEAIVRKKAQYVVEHGLGGIMFWAIDNDDFRGTCNGKPYPLIEAAKEAMLEGLGVGINEVAKPNNQHKKPSRSRSRENSSSKLNRIAGGKEGKGSTRTTLSSGRRRPQPSTTTTTERAAETTIRLTNPEGSSLYIGGRTTTPPPPTTPDPGADFKCEEEGFFQHPRDCKKYYWCLDSGPSGLGIVGHQFTCPSGLYFNPAADSCDFARNVPCKIKKATTPAPGASTTTTTTTPRPTSAPNRITAATSRSSFFRTTTSTTTTTHEPIEYEDEEEEVDDAVTTHTKERDSEEDPQVLKELIDLIRKVGGIEELEKHLQRKEDGTIALKNGGAESGASTTQSPISKNLYEKVLSKPNTYNSFRNRLTSTSLYRKTGQAKVAEKEPTKTTSDDTQASEVTSTGGSSKYSSVVRGNSRQGPQNEGLDKLPDFDGFLKEKKQYVTINRHRGAFRNKSEDDEDNETEAEEKKITVSDDEEEDDEEEETITKVKSTKRPTNTVTPSYASIRRTRPSTVHTDTEEEAINEENVKSTKESEEKRTYTLLSRNRGKYTTESSQAAEETVTNTNRYKYLERTRPTSRTQSTLSAKDEEITPADEDDDSEDEDNQEEEQNVTVQLNGAPIDSIQKSTQSTTTRTYANIGRRTTTTTTETPITNTQETPTRYNLLENTFNNETPEPILTISTTEKTITTNDSPTLSISIKNTNPEIMTTTASTTSTSTSTSASHPSITTTKAAAITTTANDLELTDSLYTITTITPNFESDSRNTLDISFDVNSLIEQSALKANPTTASATTEKPVKATESDDDDVNVTTTTTARTTSIATETNHKNTDTDVSHTNDEDEVTNLHKNINRSKTQYNKYTTRTRNITKTENTNTDLEHENSINGKISKNNNNKNIASDTKSSSSTRSSTDDKLSSNVRGNTVNKYSGGRRQQQQQLNELLTRKNQQDSSSSTTNNQNKITTTDSTPTNEFLGTISSPRPFGFPRRRTRPNLNSNPNTAALTEDLKSTTTTESTEDETRLSTTQASKPKKYQYNRSRFTTTTTTSTTTESPPTGAARSPSGIFTPRTKLYQLKRNRTVAAIATTTTTTTENQIRTPTATTIITATAPTRRPLLSVRRRKINIPNASSGIPYQTAITSALTGSTTTSQTATTITTANTFSTKNDDLQIITTELPTTFNKQQQQHQQQLNRNRTKLVAPALTATATALPTTTTIADITAPPTTTTSLLLTQPSSSSSAATIILNSETSNSSTNFKPHFNTKHRAKLLATTLSTRASPTTIITTTPKIEGAAAAAATATTSNINDIIQTANANTKQPSTLLRRKFQTRRLITTTTLSPTDVSGTDQPRTQNPLFKRRFSHPTNPSATAVTTTPADALTTTLFVEGFEVEDPADQVAKSSINTNHFDQFLEQVETIKEPVARQELTNGIKVSPLKSTFATKTKSGPVALYAPIEPNHAFAESITRRMGTVAETTEHTTSTRKSAGKRGRPQKYTPTTPQTPAEPVISRRAQTVSRRRPNKYAGGDNYDRLNSYQPVPVKQASPGVHRSNHKQIVDYDYYDDDFERVVGNTKGQQLKVILHGRGIIECLDQGNFPHPLSCRKFISCAKFETGGVVGWEYTCPKGLSYDPVGGMCNWSAGLGCKE